MNAEIRANLLRQPGPSSRLSRADILLVDDDPGAIQLMGRFLRELGDLRFATSGAEALRQVAVELPDLILLDAEMPGMSGFEVLDVFKAHPRLAHVPVIFVTSHTDPDFEVCGFQQGAADFIAKPVHPPLLLARVRAQLRFKRMADELRRRAPFDALTGVANQRQFDESLALECQRARRSGEPLSLVLVEVDHFKPYNERYGNPAGDDCLRAVGAALVASALRPADVVARVGDEAFAMILPLTPRESAAQVARRVHAGIEGLGIEHPQSATARRVTVSVGIAFCDRASASWFDPSAASYGAQRGLARWSAAQLTQAAEQALRQAEQHGGAQTWLLDVADAQMPERARKTSP